MASIPQGERVVKRYLRDESRLLAFLFGWQRERERERWKDEVNFYAQDDVDTGGMLKMKRRGIVRSSRSLLLGHPDPGEGESPELGRTGKSSSLPPPRLFTLEFDFNSPYPA